MDHKKLIQLELETLKDMYANAATILKQALLDGADWDALQEYRHDVTELEIALYKKLRMAGGNPAENQNRASTEPELN
ncbi:hypothetical protein EPD60_02890 [Flaviaesturariibacter flavus]|uniref:Uncharacterized protein n=1 Tax=Flaviaesturariibacter flavus TaxID=2502780 RepID=A0A4R1BQ23_9BACT|nr:hypothetical protein [Flaviaesturariibacter flavus]TCJ19376.1 hypothetical protein EPD60_02890 [Flaviaesturariibacter flavus]